MMSNANKEYYKRVYNRFVASDELRERLMDMEKNEFGEDRYEKNRRKSGHRVIWRVAAAAVLAVVVPISVYGAVSYWGLNELFGYRLPQEATQLIETEIPQEKKDVDQEIPVEFTVKEALCDQESVSMIIEARAKERGRYLLAFDDSCETDPVSDLGIESEQTIGEYAAEKGLEILYVGIGYSGASPFLPGVSSLDYKPMEEDVMLIGTTAERTEEQQDLHVIMHNTVQFAKGETPMISKNTFELTDKSSCTVVSYTADGEMRVKGTSATVRKIEVMETEVSNYVKVYCSYPKEMEHDEEDDGLMFRIKSDRDSEAWECEDEYSREMEKGEYYWRASYPAGEFPETCILEAYNAWDEKTVYEQFEISRVNP